MDRRELLKLGALASVGGSGCASLLANPASVGAAEMGGFLAELDGARAAIDARSFFAQFLDKPGLTARVQHGEDLAKKTLRSLLLVGTVQELPPEQMAHAGVQQRLRDSMGEFDDAMFGMTSMLEGLSPTERAGVSKALRDDPQLGMRIMGRLDEDAASFGVSLKQRSKLRAVSAQACARLRQSPDLAIAEYTGKMHKVAARHGARAELERRAGAAIGTSLLWQGESGGIDSSAFHPVTGGPAAIDGAPDAGTEPAPVDRGATGPGPETGAKTSEGIACVQAEECGTGFTCDDYKDLGDGKWSAGVCKPVPKGRKSSPGILTAGGILLGLAATGFLVVSAATSTWVFGATVGAILGTIGLVVLIIGLIVAATGH
ncbi:MAG: hypothetical protein Q8L48_13625 [Archangium sp.]|nr:hypothetical protein [Archangium sp.]